MNAFHILLVAAFSRIWLQVSAREDHSAMRREAVLDASGDIVFLPVSSSPSQSSLPEKRKVTLEDAKPRGDYEAIIDSTGALTSISPQFPEAERVNVKDEASTTSAPEPSQEEQGAAEHEVVETRDSLKEPLIIMRKVSSPASPFSGISGWQEFEFNLLHVMALAAVLGGGSLLASVARDRKKSAQDTQAQVRPPAVLDSDRSDWLDPVSLAASAKGSSVAARKAAPGTRCPVVMPADMPLVLHQPFEAVADLIPDAPAVLTALVDGSGAQVCASFGELQAASNALARWLRSEGLRKGEPVAVALTKILAGTGTKVSELQQAAILSVLKCGSPYVPIDARAWPPARQLFVIEDSKATLALADVPLRLAKEKGKGQLCKVLLLSELPPDSPTGPLAADEGFGATESDLCHILYTTGSSGRPKGVRTTHKAAASRCKWMRSALPFGMGEVVIMRAPLSFVDHVWEHFGPLGAGVPVADFPHLLRLDVKRLLSTIVACKVTRIVLLPSLARRVLDNCRDGLPSCLQQIAFSGEPLPVSLLRRTLLALPQGQGASVLNLYGSTEVAGDVTMQIWLRDSVHVLNWLQDHEMNDSSLAVAARVAPASQDSKSNLPTTAPIGKAVTGCEVYVCSRDKLQPLTTGQIGEVVVTGKHLAEGYLGISKQADSRFIQLHIRGAGSSRVMRTFRTGDIGFQDEDGTIWLCGREDDVMKIRGERVDMQEVAAAVQIVLRTGRGDSKHDPALQAPAAVVAAAQNALAEEVPRAAELFLQVQVLAYQEPQEPNSSAADVPEFRLAVVMAVPSDIDLVPAKVDKAESAIRAALRSILPASAVPSRLVLFPVPQQSAFGHEDAGTGGRDAQKDEHPPLKGECLLPRLSNGKVHRKMLHAAVEAAVAKRSRVEQKGPAACLVDGHQLLHWFMRSTSPEPIKAHEIQVI